MASPKISVVIPVYNVEKYIERCVNSVISQSFSDFEIILIDDGSTDRSGIICDKLENVDFRVRTYHKENGGVCSARNMGIENAKGDFLYFADPDDELETECLNILYDGIFGNDMAIGGYVICDSYGNKTYEVNQRITETISPNEAICLMIKSRYYYTLGMLWHSLFKTSIVKENNIRFHEGIYIYEDSLFTIEYLCKCSRFITFNTISVYKYYNNRTDSIMNTTFTTYNTKAKTAFQARKLAYLAVVGGVNGRGGRKARKLSLRALLTTYNNQCSYLKSWNREKDIESMTNELFSIVDKTDYYCYKFRELLKRAFYLLKGAMIGSFVRNKRIVRS